MPNSSHQLPAEVAAKYRCPIVPTRLELPWLGGRVVDLRTLTLAEADELVQYPRFTYLQPRRLRKQAAPQAT